MLSMNQKPSIKKNALLNILLTSSYFLFGLVTYPYAARVLTPVGTGKVSFSISLIAYFNIIAQLGIPTYGIRECARVRGNKEQLTRTVHELLMINLLTNLISYILLAGIVLIVPELRAEKTLHTVISFSIILQTIGIEWLYKALEQYSFITIKSLLFKVIAAIAICFTLHSESDYILFGALMVFALYASNLLTIFHVHKLIGLSPVGHYNLKRHWKPVFVFFAMACATTVYTNLDTVMLGFMSSDAEVGYYDSAVKIKKVLVSIVTSLGTVLLPRISYYLQNRQEREFRDICSKAFHFVIFLSFPLMVYFTLFASQGIAFLSGPLYTGAVLPMRIIMPTLVLIGLTNILGIQILIPQGRETVVLRSELLGALTDFILNIILIPRFGASGAAAGTLAAEMVVLLVQYFETRELVCTIAHPVNLFHTLLGCIAGAIVSDYLTRIIVHPFLILAISFLLFFSVYTAVMFFIGDTFALDIVSRFKSILNSSKN